MRHLFIINPAADKAKGRVKELTDNIHAFFRGYGELEYDIHVTRWRRDASAFVHRYALEAEGLVRIHSFGGSGTLFEIANGVFGLPNVQIAAHPLGKNNSFLRYFGRDKTHLFLSLRNQVFSDVTSIDALRCGGNFGISYGLVGLEAESTKYGTDMIARSPFKSDLYYIIPTAASAIRRKSLGRSYQITLDGQRLDGDYITMMIANVPCYGKNMNPAVDAHPNDGVIDIYMAKNMPKSKFLSCIYPYLKGRYDRTAGGIVHHVGKKLVISSENVMCLSLDGETFYENRIEYEVMPYAIDFVCPHGINIGKLPRIFGRPEEGFVNG